LTRMAPIQSPLELIPAIIRLSLTDSLLFCPAFASGLGHRNLPSHLHVSLIFCSNEEKLPRKLAEDMRLSILAVSIYLHNRQQREQIKLANDGINDELNSIEKT